MNMCHLLHYSQFQTRSSTLCDIGTLDSANIFLPVAPCEKSANERYWREIRRHRREKEHALAPLHGFPHHYLLSIFLYKPKKRKTNKLNIFLEEQLIANMKTRQIRVEFLKC